MKYFVLTPNGETGPYTVQQLNRLHAQGVIQGSQLCRPEDSAQTIRLDAQFRHMGDSAQSQQVVQEARKNVARYNRDEGGASLMAGGVMVFSGILIVVGLGGGPFQIGWALIIVGIGLIVRGQKQRRRGLAALTPEPGTPAQKKTEEPGKGAYDY